MSTGKSISSSPDNNSRSHLTVRENLTTMLINDMPNYGGSQSVSSNVDASIAPPVSGGHMSIGQQSTSAGSASHQTMTDKSRYNTNLSLPIPIRVGVHAIPHKYFLLGSMKTAHLELLTARLRGITDCCVDFHELTREMIANEQRVQIRCDLRPEVNHSLLHCHVGPVENDNLVHRCRYHAVPAEVTMFNSSTKRSSLLSNLHQSTQFFNDVGFHHLNDYIQEGTQFCRFLAVSFRTERIPVFARIFTLKQVNLTNNLINETFESLISTAKPFLPDIKMVEIFTVAVAIDKEAEILKSEIASFAEELAPLARIDKLEESIFSFPSGSTKSH